MANVNKRDSDSKKHKTVINVRTPLFPGGDKDTHVFMEVRLQPKAQADTH